MYYIINLVQLTLKMMKINKNRILKNFDLPKCWFYWNFGGLRMGHMPKKIYIYLQWHLDLQTKWFCESYSSILLDAYILRKTEYCSKGKMLYESKEEANQVIWGNQTVIYEQVNITNGP